MYSGTELPKDHINRLRKERQNNDANSTTLANTLDKDINTSFAGENKFILELLQNADDAAISGKEIKISIIQINDYLIFLHNGKPFSYQDVEKICDNAQQKYRDKIEDNTKTGYKGIGFKAIFSIASCVTILSSDQYRFRFDQDFYKAKDSSDKRYPWPIIPIWTENSELPEPVRTEITQIGNLSELTIFVMHLKKEVNLQEQLAYFRNDPESILFLRHINEITYRSTSAQWQLSRQLIDNNCAQILVDGSPNSCWLLRRQSQKIPEQIRQAIQNYSDFACPSRLKTATTVSITLATKVTQEGQLQRLSSGRFFSYLPTQCRLEIPLLVNSDFLLNAERTQLNENEWNKFLIQQVILEIFHWMAELAKSARFGKQILKILPPYSLRSIAPWISQVFEKAYYEAKSKIACLPHYADKSQLLTLADACYDSTGFYREFSEIKCDNSLISYELEEIDQIRGGIKGVIRLHELIDKLAKFIKENRTIEFQIRILKFFSRFKDIDKNKILENLSLFDNNMQLQPLKNLFIWCENIELPIKIDIRFVNSKIYELDSIKQFLKSIGVKEFTALMLIRGPLINVIKQDAKTLSKEDINKIHAFIMVHKDSLAEEDWWQLKELPVETTAGRMAMPSRCFFSDCYNPHQKFQGITTAFDIFISEKYLRQHSENNRWQKYFLKLGVAQNITLRILPRIHISEIKILMPKLAAAYELYLKTIYSLNIDDFSLENFPYIELFDLVDSNQQYQKYLWSCMTQISNQLISNKSYVLVNLSRIKHQPVVDIIQFVFRTYTLIPNVADNILYRSTDLFFEELPKELHQFLNVAKPPINREFAAYLGIIVDLNILQCLAILNNLDKSNIVKKDLYEIVYKQILKLIPKERDYWYQSSEIKKQIEIDKQTIANWQGRLLAYNGKLNNKKDLYYFNMTRVLMDPSPHWFMRFNNINADDLHRLAELFGIVSVKDNDVQLHSGDAKEFVVLKDKILRRCRYIAAIVAIEAECNTNDLLNEYHRTITATKFLLSDNLCLQLQARPEIQLQSTLSIGINNTLYIDSSTGMSSDTIKSIANFVAVRLKVGGTAKELLGSIIELEDESLLKMLAKKGFDADRLIIHHQAAASASTMSSPAASNQGTITAESTIVNNPFLSFTEKSDGISNQRLKDVGAKEIYLQEEMENLKRLNIGPDLETPTQFKPSISVEQCDMQYKPIKKIQLTGNKLPEEKNNATSTLSSNMKSAASPAKSPQPSKSFSSGQHQLSKGQAQALAEIGKWSEAYVYRRLRAHYEAKYPTAKISETESGFTFFARNKRLGEIQYNLIWHNRDLESGKSRDFTLQKGVEERVIEVKGTVSASGTVHITGSEFKEMERYKNHYRLFRVVNAGQSHVEVQQLKDPAQAIHNNQLEIQKIELRWKV